MPPAGRTRRATARPRPRLGDDLAISKDVSSAIAVISCAGTEQRIRPSLDRALTSSRARRIASTRGQRISQWRWAWR